MVFNIYRSSVYWVIALILCINIVQAIQVTYTGTLIRFQINESDVMTIIPSGDGGGSMTRPKSDFIEYVNIPRARRPNELKSIYLSISFYMVVLSMIMTLLLVLSTKLKKRERHLYSDYDED